MKAKRIIMVMTGLIISCQISMAQAKIDRIAEELEKTGVECSKVISRDPKTKKVVSIVKSFEFKSKNGKWAERLKKAFAAEAVNATSEISEKGGRDWCLIFNDSIQHMIYTLEIGDQKPDPKVELNIIINIGKGLKNILNGITGSLNMEGFEKDMEEFGREMEKFGKEFEESFEKTNEPQKEIAYQNSDSVKNPKQEPKFESLQQKQQKQKHKTITRRLN